MKKLTMMAVMLVLALSFVYAAKETAQPTTAGTTTDSNEKQQTYGQCVSTAADTKNTCYDAAKSARDTCLSVKNESDKNGVKECKQEYSKNKDQCKKDFKQAKNECKKIKHNFFETMRYSMK